MSNIRDLWYDWLGINTWLFKKVNFLSDIPIYSSLMKFITVFGDKKLLPYIIGAIIIFAISSFIVRVTIKKGGNRNYLFTWISIFLMIGAGLFAINYTTNYIQNNASYPRPYMLIHANEIKILEIQPAEEAYRSFPSSHVAIITVLVFALWPIAGEKSRWAGILFIFTVAWSRMAMGVNFPMDVISGFAIPFIQMSIIRYILYGTIRTVRHTLKI